MIEETQARQFTGVGLVFASLCSMMILGCGGSSSEPGSLPDTSGELTAEQVLEKMRSVYREAESYTDNAVYMRRSVLRSEGVERELPFYQLSVAYERPNKLRFRFQEGITTPTGGEEYQVVSDGRKVRSTAGSVPDQIHETIAPLDLTPENFIPEPNLRGAILGVPLENLHPPLLMLLSGSVDSLVFPEDSDPKLIEDKKLGESNCHRVSMKNPSGKRVLWIDSESFALKRMELPIESQLAQLDPNDIYSRIAIHIDFQEVSLDAEIDAPTFEIEVPEGSRRVRRFIPPPPQGPSPDLGEPVGDFRFVTLSGEEITRESLDGKVAVLDFWHTRCPPCKSQMPLIDKVYQAYQDNPDVAFYAVSTDFSRIVDEEVSKTMKAWGGSMPVLRDFESTAYDKLNVRVTPTMILLGRDGRLQTFKKGLYSDPQTLIDSIQKLIDGEDLAAIAVAQYEKQVREYQLAIDSATIKDSIVEVEVARPEFAPRKLPEKLNLEQLWQSENEDLKHPGDILSINDASGSAVRIVVVDKGSDLIELDSSGSVIARHSLPEHEEQSNGFLRTIVDGEGHRWYLASGVGWQQLYLFDENWQSTLSFPEEPHSGIGDVLFGELSETGDPTMYVGYWGGLGVQSVSSAGRRLWANRRLDHVLQIARGPTASEEKRQIWCTSSRGTVTQLSTEDKTVRELYVTGHSLMSVALSESVDESKTHSCGLAVQDVGQYTVVGFDAEGTVEWEYTLPTGEYVNQVPRIQAVQLSSDQQAWLVVAADGSLHWLSLAGELIDQFQYGSALTGVAASYVDNIARLFVATNENLTAWKINLNDEP